MTQLKHIQVIKTLPRGFNCGHKHIGRYTHHNHAIWTLSIESRLERFVIVVKCMQDYMVLTYSSSFEGTKIHGNGV